jgi:8-oxo-dGTP diphosphatase
VTGRSDVRGDGDGWVRCAQGHRHWGLFGAAGLLVHRPRGDGAGEVLLQHRAEWSHHGGTWGLLGGARMSTESAVAAALREAGEEGGLPPSEVRVDGRYDDDHGGWSYATVLATETGVVEAAPTGGESIDVSWWPVAAVEGLPLHPGFARTWPLLRAATVPLAVVVDAAGVVRSGPEGWRRNREGAVGRLVAACAALVDRGLSDAELPAALSRAGLGHWWPQLTVVAQGPPTDANGAHPGAGRLRVVPAAASAGDAVLAAAAALGDRPVLVVTSDQALRDRSEAVGAAVAGPDWLLSLLPPNHRG